MPGRDAKPRPPTALGRALKIYREHHKFTQEQMATLLDEDPRQIRRWENGETQLTDMRELKRIADRLGIPYKDLGIAASLYIPVSLEEINTRVDRIWSLIDEARIDEAYAIAENLTLEASQRTGTSDIQMLHTLARMYHAAAHAASLSLKTDEVGQVIYYYQQMEYFAQQLKDDTLLNIALAYQGDMLRRKGDIPHAIVCLERARNTTPQADKAARGNGLQLLARAYVQGQNLDGFDTAIKEAEDLAYAIDQQNNSVRQFNLGYVFEEYAKSYCRLGKTRLALDYAERAEKARIPTKSSEILLKVVRAEILVRDGDVRNAVLLAAESAIYSREHGHNRRLERIYAIKRYIHQQATKYGKAEWELNEALEGPNEY
ncbi:MAG: helix-turn-helix domain-containing protein [Chloroflexota bacterium]|nr:helix-turn-helix domain-containing protein [Chloroflexota bacterium]